MALFVSQAIADPNPTMLPNDIEIAVSAHVDRPSARGGARYTLPADRNVFFETSSGLFKRVFLPEFRLTNIPIRISPSLRVVTDAALPPPVTFLVVVEMIDLEASESKTRSVTIAVQV